MKSSNCQSDVVQRHISIKMLTCLLSKAKKPSKKPDSEKKARIKKEKERKERKEKELKEKRARRSEEKSKAR